MAVCFNYSSDGSTVFAEFENGIPAFPFGAGGAGGTFLPFATPMSFSLVAARGKLYVGQTAYDDKSGKALGTFTSTAATWQLMPETGADRAVAFTCDASGGNPQLTLLDTTNYQAMYSRPISGLPVVSGAGVNGSASRALGWYLPYPSPPRVPAPWLSSTRCRSNHRTRRITPGKR